MKKQHDLVAMSQDQTTYYDGNVFVESCRSCCHADTNPPEDADWWIRCKLNHKPRENNFYKTCDKYKILPFFEHNVM